jgi:hypothetical protein
VVILYDPRSFDDGTVYGYRSPRHQITDVGARLLAIEPGRQLLGHYHLVLALHLALTLPDRAAQSDRNHHSAACCFFSSDASRV